MEVAAWYRWFAEHEARGSSPRYERLAREVAANQELLRWLLRLPAAKRQPNLLFAAVRYLGGPTESVTDFTDFVARRCDELEATMSSSKSTQTNEVARCAAFVPLLAELDAEVALIEVGASAGLCLFPDRYAYRYDGALLGDASLVIDVDTAGTVPVPRRLPTVTWRAGLDLEPLDVAKELDRAWLRACVWPEHDERLRRLDLAVAIVAESPPRIERGDLRSSTLDLLDEAPNDAIKVVFHSAVLAYLDEASRNQFASTMRRVVAERNDVVWLSNESPSAVGLPPDELSTELPTGGARFHLGRNGADLVAVTDPHGGWIRWTNR